MFVDASALVAILTDEPEGRNFARAIERAEQCSTSPLAIFETVLNVRRKLNIELGVAVRLTKALVEEAGIAIVPIDKAAGDLALSAFARYGKGLGHPAQLNLGDCFAYGMAKVRGVPLLYKGSDFAQTDVEDGQAA